MPTWLSINGCEGSTTSCPPPLEALVTGPLLLLQGQSFRPTVRVEVSVQKGLLEPPKQGLLLTACDSHMASFGRASILANLSVQVEQNPELSQLLSSWVFGEAQGLIKLLTVCMGFRKP